ncbi:hypothetical protein [Agaribacter marinus]|nr:hypothetical protein [Agaribacter marinus]
MSLSILQHVFKENIAKNQWILEHIGHMIGSGIEAYTAFLSFGGRRVLQVGVWEILFWIAPGIIGSIASYIVSKKYKKLFHIKVIGVE